MDGEYKRHSQFTLLNTFHGHFMDRTSWLRCLPTMTNKKMLGPFIRTLVTTDRQGFDTRNVVYNLVL